ncbi:hypothetical protein B9G69_009220 [Bdellovibrio sp. SKB1291214]|uniref:hypothetical protein n=1 Tax=Bdellovibrio sp. SKB1291214 TaxID=1732569 RepID=UPI000B51971D|nr:hypothetical protein [Bdellovibrio sp. SKB1291214]UYL07226.1 hypothetical protein B9G69_009220 [Bdellovibrio sp. SKB1291214]
MKTVLITIATLLCAQAFADDTSTSTLKAVNPGQSSSAPVAEASITTQAPSKENPWHLTIGSENFNYEGDNRGTEAGAIISYNFVGARYAPTKAWELELRQQFQYTSSREHLGARDSKLHRDSSVAMAETILRGALRPKGWMNSSFGLVDLRYYAPTDVVAQENHEMGRLRLDNYFEWMINPKFTMAGLVSSRVLFNSAGNPNTAVGADAEYYQLKAAPIFIYTMNDKVNPYYAYTISEKSSQAQRGNWEPDMGNLGSHEIGLNLYYGAFYINPALISDTNLENGGGSMLSADSRAFSYENISYNLNVYAVF